MIDSEVQPCLQGEAFRERRPRFNQHLPEKKPSPIHPAPSATPVSVMNSAALTDTATSISCTA